MSRLLLVRIVRPIRHVHLVQVSTIFGSDIYEGCNCDKVSVDLNEFRLCPEASFNLGSVVRVRSYMFWKMQTITMTSQFALFTMRYALSIRQIDIVYYMLTSEKYKHTGIKIFARSNEYVEKNNSQFTRRKYIIE